MAYTTQTETRITTVFSTKKLLFGLSAIDLGWLLHIFIAAWIGYYAFHGHNPLQWLGLDAPPYKMAVVAIAEGARAILSMTNVWEEEINWAASTILVLVLLTAGGADVSRLPSVGLSGTQQVSYKPFQCTFYNNRLGRQLTDAEKGECVAHMSGSMMDVKWAKNCGCS